MWMEINKAKNGYWMRSQYAAKGIGTVHEHEIFNDAGTLLKNVERILNEDPAAGK